MGRKLVDQEVPVNNEFFFWDDKYFDSELGFDSTSILDEKQAKPQCVIKCWMEDWEVEAVAKHDAVAEAKQLCKYGGLQFYDIDEKKMCHLSSDELVWLGK